ncbi:hypothetical protein VTN00DRAFT_5134 [Thermoascus crustaceus]|uniref:uncharacterized protein n=1 Tax=Thermoascus crustaceus TaxID=5088 RepID=UPI003742527C
MEPRWATARETGRAGVERSSRGRRWLASGDRLHLLSARCPSSLVTATAILSLFFSPPPLFPLLFRPSFVSPASHRLLVWFSYVASRATTWIPLSPRLHRICASHQDLAPEKPPVSPCGQAPGGLDLGESKLSSSVSMSLRTRLDDGSRAGQRHAKNAPPCEERAVSPAAASEGRHGCWFLPARRRSVAELSVSRDQAPCFTSGILYATHAVIIFVSPCQ